MFGRYVHPQLIDDISIGLCARFNIKAESKDVAKYIKNFGYDIEKGDDLIMTGFPIGKIESQEQFASIQVTALRKSQYFNVKTGRWMNDGNTKMVYGTGWCAKRNSPEHQAMLKIVESDDSEDMSFDIDRIDNWLVVEHTKYIWSKEKECIVGRLVDGEPIALTHKAIKLIKKAGYPFERVEDLENYKVVV